MKRQTAREIAIQLICGADLAGMGYCSFAESFMEQDHYETLASECDNFADYPDDVSVDYINEMLALMDEHAVQIDEYISKYSKGWGIRRISSSARAVLRTAICEIIYMDKIPVGASINSAVEIDKGYDDPDVVSFVNGVLGGFVRGEGFAETDKLDTEAHAGEESEMGESLAGPNITE